MISAFFLLNAKGDPIVFKVYRPDVKRTVADLFRIHVISSPVLRPPILRIGSTTFFHIKHENIFLLCVSKCNPNVAMIFEFMTRFLDTLVKFFGTVNETRIKENFVLVYELIDEICDFGFPQNTDSEALKLLMTTEVVQGPGKSDVDEFDASKIAIQATGQVTWRRPDIIYKKNEIFCDVVESMNVLISSTGTILNADIKGQVLLRTYLTGMPECRLGLNDRFQVDKTDETNLAKEKKQIVQLDDCQFHQCVRLSQVEHEKSITFIPPDGDCELIRYRTTENISVPFKIQVILTEIGNNKLEYKVAVRSLYGAHIYAENIFFNIPVPPNTSNCVMKVTKGKSKMPRMAGSREHLFEAQVELTKTTSNTGPTHHNSTTTNVNSLWTSRPPISVDFQVTAFTASGLIVRYLKLSL